MPSKQNQIANSFLKGSDLAEREKETLKDITSKIDFKPIKILSRSAWWGSSQIGAFHYAGIYEDKKAVLKIQGIKPETSEIYMINSFIKNNKSKILRPPSLYASLPWNNQKQYEALILEFVDGPKIIETLPATKQQIKSFFEVFQDYRKNCLRHPWIEKPKKTISGIIEENFTKWEKTSNKIYPSHPLRKKEDELLINSAVKILIKKYANIQLEFQHGHFSELDLYHSQNQIVILSNLYWSWRTPFYDAVFGYHWYMYHLNSVAGITPKEVEIQRKLWLNKINALAKTNRDKKLLKLAFLERAVAGLILDGLSADPNKPIAEYLIERTRRIIRELISELI